MVHNVKINWCMTVVKNKFFLTKIYSFYKKIKKSHLRTFNFYFKQKMLIVAMVFLPMVSITSIFYSQKLPRESYIYDSEFHISTSTGDILKIDESINFSFIKSQIHTKVEVFPDIPVKIIWNTNKTELNIEPVKTWGEFESYEVVLTKYLDDDNSDDKSSSTAVYKFNVEEKPKILKSIPKIGSKKSVLENNNIIRVFFDRSISNYEFFVKIENNEILKTDFNSDNNSLTIILKDSIKAKQNLEISIFGRYDFLKDEIDVLGTISMEVIPSKPNSWPIDKEDRLNIASESTIPYIGDGKYIDVNLESHITTLYSDGEIIHQFINSPGAKDSPTIKGVFKVKAKALKPISNTFKVFLPYWISFTDDGMYGLHSLVEWPANHPDFPNSPGGGKESIRSIDKAISPGCIRHTDQDSKLIYEWAEIGTVIYIY